MAWFWLIIAIVFEVCGTLSLKLSLGLTRLIPTLTMAFAYCISFSALALTLKTLEVSLAYAIWSGLGTGLIALIGILFFGESLSIIKAVSLLLIIAGVVGLNLTNTSH